MFAHVHAVLAACSAIEEIILLGDVAPGFWSGSFERDEGRGLNAELADLVARRSSGPTLIIHADLPLLAIPEVGDLLAKAGRSGYALAPDRAATGTNALALVDPIGFAFHFGPGSFARHREGAEGAAQIVERPGLATDIDTPDDYRDACRAAPEIMRRLCGSGACHAGPV